MTTENKYFLFANSIINFQKYRGQDANFTYGYMPKGFKQFKCQIEPNMPVRPNVGVNFAKIFEPYTILPVQQGVSGYDRLVGNSFYWKESMFDIIVDPRVFRNIYRSPTSDEIVSNLTYVQHAGFVGGVVNSKIGKTVYNVSRGTTGSVLTSTTLGTGAIESAHFEPDDQTPDNIVTTLPEFQKGISEVYVVNPDDTIAERNVQNIQTPMYMMPTYKPYFCLRFLIVKLKMPYNDYANLLNSADQWSNFLNALYWNRNGLNARTMETEPPQMTLRSKDYNVQNPYGGQFQVVDEQLCYVNPFDIFRYRFNLCSGHRYGDKVTLKDNNVIYIEPDEIPDTVLFQNGLYIGLVLFPLSIQDFDPLTASIIEEQSLYMPGTVVRKPAARPDPIQVQGPWVAPNYTINNVNYGELLKMMDIQVCGRTRYID